MKNKMKKYYLSVHISTRVKVCRFSEIYADDRTQTCPTSGRRACVPFVEIISFPTSPSAPLPFPATHLVSTDQASLRISFYQNAALAV